MDSSQNEPLLLETSVSKVDDQILDYSSMLMEYGASYKPFGNYYRVGDLSPRQGWIIHLSVIKTQIEKLIRVILPSLSIISAVYEVVRDKYLGECILGGNFGYSEVGKILSIYPTDTEQAIALVEQLVRETAKFRGPAIPTDIHLGSIVYARYGVINPLTLTTEQGHVVRGFYDDKSNFVIDAYSIPFSMPVGVKYPFSAFANPVDHRPKRILNAIYKPLFDIKSDSKGNVSKGLYLKNLWTIKPCVIKEGRANMFTDGEERDIQDRLLWQFKVYEDLHDVIPMPKIFACFKEAGSTYLAMQFVKGISLDEFIRGHFCGNSWDLLDLTIKKTLLSLLLEILEILERLHLKGYIHRDATPSNFIIDKRNKVYLIDMELSWSKSSFQSSVPFNTGTIGFMSPEQENIMEPTYKEDIYGLGALMIVFFTSVSPVKFDTSSIERLKKDLQSIIPISSVVDIICRCLNPDPAQRPDLSQIKSSITGYFQSITRKVPLLKNSDKAIEGETLTDKAILLKGINGLTLNKFQSGGIWSSKAVQRDLILNEQLGKTVQMGLHSGISGILMCLSEAQQVGIRFDRSMPVFRESLNYVRASLLHNFADVPAGLFYGTYGIALSLANMVKANLLSMDLQLHSLIKDCLLKQYTGIDISRGVCGQVLSLLEVVDILPDPKIVDGIEQGIKFILEAQSSDGSWPIKHFSNRKTGILLGHSYGISGLIWTLLRYQRAYRSAAVNRAIQKAFAWLMEQPFYKFGKIHWPVISKTIQENEWSLGYGSPGIILTLIEGYQQLEISRLKEIALLSLRQYPYEPLLMDYNMETGLAGLGIVLNRANRLSASNEFTDRSNWIKRVFSHTSHLEHGAIYWNTDHTAQPTAGLYSGTGGILYFLIDSFSKGINNLTLY